MAHLYLLEFFVDSVIIMPALDDYSGSSKSLIIKIKFGKNEFLIKENQIISNDVIPKDEFIDRNWIRSIRVGKSFLFPSAPEAFRSSLMECPLGIELWTDDDKEKEIFVGFGELVFPSNFYFMVKQEAIPCSPVEPLTIKQTVPLNAECCCKVCAHINLILRLTCVGNSTTTTFQQLMTDPKTFVFETEKVRSAYECKRIDKLDQYEIVGDLYADEIGLHPPRVQTVEVCTDMEECAKDQDVCIKEEVESFVAKNATKVKNGNIKMGDITGLCGNVDCPMAHRIRNYLRQSDAYKKIYEPTKVKKQSKTKVVCGKCICRTEQWKGVETCIDFNKPYPDKDKVAGICKNCGGYVGYNEMNCQERRVEAGGSPMRVNNNPTIMSCTIDTKISFGKPHKYAKDESNKANSAGLFEKLLRSSSGSALPTLTGVKQAQGNDKEVQRCLSTSALSQYPAENNPPCSEECKLLNELASIILST